MKSLSVIREILRYVQRFKDSTIFVKLGKDIIDIAEQLGIIRDLCAIKNSGINIVVVYDFIEFSAKKWAIPEFFFCDFDNFSSKKNYSKAIPIIYCPAKNNLSSDARIALMAVKNNARKLIYITNRKGIFNNNKKLISEMSISEARALIDNGIVQKGMKTKLEAACMACQRGVKRVHIISGFEKGAILREVFSCEGIGTMIYAIAPYKYIRQAVAKDVASIMDILNDSEISISVSYSRIVEMINSFYVFTIDEEVLGCAQLRLEENNSAEILYLSSFSYCKQVEISRELVRHIIQYAFKKGVNKIYFDPSQNSVWITIYPWFKKGGFKKINLPSVCGLNYLKNKKGGSRLWVKEP